MKRDLLIIEFGYQYSVRIEQLQAVIQQNPFGKSKQNYFRIGTLNAKTELKEVKDQMNKGKIDILDVGETKWARNCYFISDKFRTIKSGSEKKRQKWSSSDIAREMKKQCTTQHISFK